jgi:manganese/zinc/iron transport system substrate-binding protein
MKRFTAIALPLMLGLVLLAGCGGGGDGSAGPQVIATTGMIGWLAGEVAGDAVSVFSLMGPGVDPHLYKASEGDVRRLGEAKLILYNGLHLEGKMGDILGKMGRGRPVIAVTRDLPPAALRALAGTADQHDPHVWFDVSLWARTLTLIESELSAVFPEHAAGFAERARRLEAELAELDAWVAAEIAKVPAERRILITAHDAFGYFGDRYDIEVMGLQGVSTLAEAGLQDVESLVETIVSRSVKAVFVESSVPKRSIEAVQAACRDRGHAVAIGGELFSDAMGAAGSPEGSYPGMVRHNVHTIVEALK